MKMNMPDEYVAMDDADVNLLGGSPGRTGTHSKFDNKWYFRAPSMGAIPEDIEGEVLEGGTLIANKCVMVYEDYIEPSPVVPARANPVRAAAPRVTPVGGMNPAVKGLACLAVAGGIIGTICGICMDN